MIVPDANLLLYAYDSTSAQHAGARNWLRQAFSGKEIVGLPWQTAWAFLRISTNSRIVSNCLSTEQAIGIVEQWMRLKSVRLLGPGERHWSLLCQMILEGNVRGACVTDAQLAALTIEYGGVLYTTDRDFARFPGLRWINPLAKN